MAADSQRDITELLIAWRRGDEEALSELMPRVYLRLKEMASSYLRRERPDHTFQTTDLVNEACARLIQHDRIQWVDRAHFLAISAQIMRRILVDHARAHKREKRGGADAFKVPLSEWEGVGPLPASDLLDLDQALRDLTSRDVDAARIIELRFFGGLNREEISAVLGISSATVTRRWRMARAWLFYCLSQEREAHRVDSHRVEARRVEAS